MREEFSGSKQWFFYIKFYLGKNFIHPINLKFFNKLYCSAVNNVLGVVDKWNVEICDKY